MAYPIIEEHRIPFDLDGTEIGFQGTNLAARIAAWATQAQKTGLNQDNWNGAGMPTYGDPAYYYVFFPELTELNRMRISGEDNIMTDATLYSIDGSADTSNGLDGTWTPAVFQAQTEVMMSPGETKWRTHTFTTSFPSPVKVVRIRIRIYSEPLRALHLYGRKYAGQTPDDLAFCFADGQEMTALAEWGDLPEGTTEVRSYKIKNLSQNKMALEVNLQLNHEHYTMAWSASGPWQSVLDLASIAPASTSATFYVRCLIPPPLQALGPFNGRIIATVGSWS